MFLFLFSENIALNKQATQSGAYFGQAPQLANDGDVAQRLGVCSTSFSALSFGEFGQSAWWSVDLASQDPSQRFVVINITIYYCRCRGMFLFSETFIVAKWK